MKKSPLFQLSLLSVLGSTLAAAEPVRLQVDFTQPDGAWNMPALALGQGGLQGDPMIDHFVVHPNNYEEWERLCEALARHCLEEGFEVAAWEVCNEPDIGEMGGTPHYFRSAADYNQFYTRTVAGLLRGTSAARRIWAMSHCG